jgi:DNA-binding response OmpR family regulator
MNQELRVLLVDDDLYAIQPYFEALADAGFSVSPAQSASQAIDLARTELFDAVVLDIMMAPGAKFTSIETAGGFKTGIALARSIRDFLPNARILAFTQSTDPEVEAWFTSDESVDYLAKPSPPREVVRRVRRLLNREGEPPRVFIVHGRDHTALRELQNLLELVLPLSTPIVLADQPSRGLTLIEKFERYAADSDLAFVILTPDDVGNLVGQGSPVQRPRMNVLFELGYFLGTLRRRSGRVFLLKKGDLELPSDLAGIVYIDVSEGVSGAIEFIRRELQDWL